MVVSILKFEFLAGRVLLVSVAGWCSAGVPLSTPASTHANASATTLTSSEHVKFTL